MPLRPLVLPVLALVLVLGCAPATPAPADGATTIARTASTVAEPSPTPTATTTTPTVRALPEDTDVDYQLGGAAEPASNVGIVDRDRNAAPASGLYNICYVNAFQTQPDEKSFWKQRSSLVLHHKGKRVVDSAWGEWLLDVGTAKKRAKLAAIVGGWIEGCASSGFDAVEFDNLDSYTRSRHELARSDAIAFARLLVATAHASGLAAGQKNLAGYDGTRIGFDFAVAEECGRWRECGSYTDDYGRQVVVVEYRAVDFAWTCRHYGDQLAVVLRDRDLTPAGVHEWC
ncbi:MAG: endo alpha-1,4 polygalactosaminidase [Propionicimonas sp.]|uniref:endo alpha-1,4 polygalactosaminidase n=1 Tax=Propionicimonas sp. TaxID=1955623 RepID=UPI003D0E3DA9